MIPKYSIHTGAVTDSLHIHLQTLDASTGAVPTHKLLQFQIFITLDGDKEQNLRTAALNVLKCL